MNKRNLKTGHIIVNRAGHLGVVLKTEGYILYRESGKEWLHDFNENLTFYDNNSYNRDIMEVYTGCTFSDLHEQEPVYRREKHWRRAVSPETFAQMRKHEARQKKNRKDDLIQIIAQQFYGNMTCTEILRKNIKFFLRGALEPKLFPGEDRLVKMKVVRIPNETELVVVYDQNQEDEYVNHEFPELYAREGKKYKMRWGEEMKMHVSCEIPQIGFKIHTRCFACRMDSTGEFISLKPEDYSIVGVYFTR